MEFERILNPAEDAPLSVEAIREGPLAAVYWRIPASGTELADTAAGAIEDLWSAYLEQLDGTPYLAGVEGADATSAGDFVPEEGDWRATVSR